MYQKYLQSSFFTANCSSCQELHNKQELEIAIQSTQLYLVCQPHSCPRHVQLCQEQVVSLHIYVTVMSRLCHGYVVCIIVDLAGSRMPLLIYIPALTYLNGSAVFHACQIKPSICILYIFVQHGLICFFRHKPIGFFSSPFV